MRLNNTFRFPFIFYEFVRPLFFFFAIEYMYNLIFILVHISVNLLYDHISTIQLFCLWDHYLTWKNCVDEHNVTICPILTGAKDCRLLCISSVAKYSQFPIFPLSTHIYTPSPLLLLQKARVYQQIRAMMSLWVHVATLWKKYLLSCISSFRFGCHFRRK